MTTHKVKTKICFSCKRNLPITVFSMKKGKWMARCHDCLDVMRSGKLGTPHTEKYLVTATLIVRCEIVALSRFDAIEQLAGQLSDTQSWQAWSEDPHFNWLDVYPIITCVS